MSRNDDLAAFVRGRNAVLLSLDRERIRGFYRKWGVPLPSDEAVFWLSVHKARVACRQLPMPARTLSKRWLLARGSEPLDDGEVPA